MDIRALVAVLILSASLSGCLTEGKGASGNEDGLVVDDSPPYTQDGIYNCIDHDNLTRCWQVHIPDDLDPEVPVPLIIDMHGYASNSIEHRKLSSFDEIADEEGAIVVYPDGVAGYNMQWDLEENQAWNSGWCCALSTRDPVRVDHYRTHLVGYVIEGGELPVLDRVRGVSVHVDDERDGHVGVEVLGHVDLPAPGQVVVFDAVEYPVLGVRGRIVHGQPVLVP